MFYSLYLYFCSVSNVLKLELKLFFQNFGPLVIEMYSCFVQTQENISTCTYMLHCIAYLNFRKFTLIVVARYPLIVFVLNKILVY